MTRTMRDLAIELSLFGANRVRYRDWYPTISPTTDPTDLYIYDFDDRNNVELIRKKPWHDYMVDEDGTVYSKRGAPMKPYSDHHGYHCLYLRPKGGRTGHYRVHRVVLEAFNGPAPIYIDEKGVSRTMVGCHNNSQRQDNRIDNLRWDTAASNVADRAPTHGMQNTMAKYTRDTILAIRKDYEAGVMPKELSKRYQIPLGTINSIVYRTTWKHI